LLLPFREFDRHPEHGYTFVPENIPFVSDDDFLLVHAEAIDPKVIIPAYWEGEQILLIYARGTFIREAGFMLSQVSVHNEQQIITGKRIVELEDSLGEREKQINCLTQIIAERDRQIDVLNQRLKEHQEQIALLNQKMKRLEGSLSWRSTKPLRDARQGVKFLKKRVTNAFFGEAKDNGLRSKAKMSAEVIKDKLVSNPDSTETIPYEDQLLDAVQAEIVFCYRADRPNVEGYYERVYSKEERLYWFPVLDWIRDRSSVKRVADIGAAYGTLLLYAIKCHFPDHSLAIDAIGIMSPHLIGRYNITYLNRDIERSAVDDIGTYDLILFTETLEHLNFHPVPTLCKLRQMLSGNGQIILTTPDALEWGQITTYYPSLDAIPRYTGQVVEWIDGHIWQYTREEVEMVVRAAGLEVAKFAYARGVSGGHLCFLLRVSSSSEK
jgi:SAM-dependent methyltransferase